MGGMWGMKKGCIEDFPSFLKGIRMEYFSDDQRFLQRVIYPLVKDKALCHDEIAEKVRGITYPNCKPFPEHEPLEFGNFVGQKIKLDK